MVRIGGCPPHEWDALVKNFNAHKYTVTDCTDKEFVEINITRDADFNYYMDQTRMITEITKEAKLTRAKDERLPYPIGNDPISKADSATEEQKFECSKYPYRRVVGQLMYGMVHTMIGIMYALNVLSRYGNRTKTHRVPETPAQVLQVQQDGSTHVSHTQWTNGH